MSYPAASANIVLLWGRWYDHKSRAGRTDHITATPLLATGQSGSGMPNLIDTVDEAEIKTGEWTTQPLSTGLWALPLLPTTDAQLGSFGGYQIAAGQEPTFIVEILENAATLTVTSEMVDAITQACQLSGAADLGITAGATVQAVWVRNAAVLSNPAPSPADGYLTSQQVVTLLADTVEDMGSGDLPEAFSTRRTTAQTAASLVGVTTPFGGSSGISQPLPAATVGRVLAVRAPSAADGLLTLTPNGTDTIGDLGNASFTVPQRNELVTLHCSFAGAWQTAPGNKAQSGLDARHGAILNTHLLAWVYAQAFRLAATRVDTVGTTSGSATVTDTAITATDKGRPVSGSGIPAGSYVGTVTAGASFLLSSSPTSQVNVPATATAASVSATLLGAARDSNSAILAASIVWPDGSVGIFTTTTASSSFPGAIDAFSVTYVPATGATKTVTQAAVTRDAAGAVTAQPALAVA